jgi:hypothetical protein
MPVSDSLRHDHVGLPGMLLHRLSVRKLPVAIEDYRPLAVQADHVVPARRDRQAVRRRTVAAAELDRLRVDRRRFAVDRDYRRAL